MTPNPELLDALEREKRPLQWTFLNSEKSVGDSYVFRCGIEQFTIAIRYRCLGTKEELEHSRNMRVIT
jgi:hypothetical protein